jgi:pSer/pThr/pTyr-binding forkhead associated (FHA) protein/ABC-type multidrug transport system ATPase subunit
LSTKYTLRVNLPDGQTRDYALSASGLSLGRSQDNDVFLQDPKVSGHHARIMLSGPNVQVVDLGSSNGTHVNGQPIPAQVPRTVNPGDTIQVGDTTVRVQSSQTAAAAPPRERGDIGLVLQVQVAGLIDEIPVTKPELDLGRANDNDVILESPPVSGHHARLSLGAGGLQVMDLGSLNGTRLNGQPLRSRVPTSFRAGDRIQISDYTFAVRAVTADAPAPPPLTAQVRLSPRGPAGLVVHVAGQQKRHPLKEPTLTLGRASDNDIVVSSPLVSGHHARIQRSDGTFWITDLGSSNGLLFGGQRVSQKALDHGDVLYIGQEVVLEFREHIGFQPVAPRPVAAPPPTQMIDLTTDTISIGRSSDNAMVLDHPQVSRYHAVVERLGRRQRITDLKSSNGVFVNGQPIEKQAWLKEGDEIRIGPYRLCMGQNALQRMAEEGLRVDALRLQKWVTKNKNLLQDISLSIHPQEFVALVGLSGAGKSTLMDAINGFRPATHGAVFVNHVDLYQKFDMFRNDMGYVPQRDIVHTELTVYKALDYAAQLRMPADTAPEERHQRIMEVLEELDLAERRSLPIHKLSGGQLKRVSIGVELLTKPRLFFLDEPTSGLDPGTEYNMMRLLRKLADQGRTIVLITHATKNVMMCDKVIILVRGGHMAYYGPPEEALTYFDQFRSDQEQRTKDIEFDDIYTILEDEERGASEEWAERYKSSSQYVENVVNRLKEREGPAPATDAPTGATAAGLRRMAAPKRVSALRQLLILSMRNLRIMTEDKASLALMLALSPIIGLMGFMWGGELFDPVEGDPGKIITMLFMNGLITILVGALASVREIVKEIDIYKRERAINLKIVPYIMSKVWVGFVLALYQALVFLIFQWIMADLGPDRLGLTAWFALYVTLFLGAISGYLMGLAISAAAPNQNMALLLVIVVLVPQFLFAGGLLPLDLIPGGEIISYVVSTRWAFEAAVNLTEFGEPLVDDPCWDDRDKYSEDGELGWNDYLNMSDEEKIAAGCTCMGSRIFTGPCSEFPGIMNDDYYTGDARAALAQEEPAQQEQPTPRPTLTPLPTLTPYPTMTPLPTPSNPADFGDYMDEMQAQGDEYQDLRELQGDEYQDLRELQGDDYQDVREEQGDEYEDAMSGYADDRADWQRNRKQAIGGAEGMLKSIFEGYGRAFRGSYVTRWATMSVILVGLLILIIGFQKRKDTV